jgi:hypothetical protein
MAWTPNIPVTGTNNTTQSVRDNFAWMKEQITTLQGRAQYRRVLFAMGYPGTDAAGYEGPVGPWPYGTLWFSSDYGILSVWKGAPGATSGTNWSAIA